MTAYLMNKTRIGLTPLIIALCLLMTTSIHAFYSGIIPYLSVGDISTGLSELSAGSGTAIFLVGASIPVEYTGLNPILKIAPAFLLLGFIIMAFIIVLTKTDKGNMIQRFEVIMIGLIIIGLTILVAMPMVIQAFDILANNGW